MLKIEKFFRDPLYGFIGLTKKEVELLGIPVVQRLRRIKQLGNTHLVYPSACHSRASKHKKESRITGHLKRMLLREQ